MLAKVVVLALALNAINCTVFLNSGFYGGYGTGLLGAGNLGISSYSLGGLGGLGSLGYGYGAGLGLARVGALGLGAKAVGLGGVGLLGAYGGGPVNAAVLSAGRTVDYRAVPYSGDAIVPQIVDVPPTEQPVQINFQSKSSPLIVSQTHIPGEPGQVQVTQSEDEPHRLIHTVTKPVIQEVNEVIQPYRQLTQEVNPVIEQAHTTVSQGEGARITGLAGGIIGGSGLANVYGAKALGLGGVYGTGLGGVYGTGLGYGLGTSGIYGTGLLNSGLYGARVFGAGLASPAVFGTTAKITRF